MKKDFNINNLQIASPCHIGWENMTGTDRARFCQSCKLNVYNISALKHAEIEKLIIKTDGRICGRIYRRMNGTVLTKDCPVGLVNIRKRSAKFVGAIFASILSLVSINFAQKNDNKHEKTGSAQITRNQIVDEKSLIKGIVLDQNGALIPNTGITLINLENKKSISAKTDENGVYKLNTIDDGDYKLLINADNFILSRIEKLNVKKNEFIVVDVSLESAMTVTVGIFVDSVEKIDTSASSPTYTIKLSDN